MRKRKCTSGCASASLSIAATMCPVSVAADLRNLRRAGTFCKRSRTSTSVPTGAPNSRDSFTTPPCTSMRYAASRSRVRVVRNRCDTAAIGRQRFAAKTHRAQLHEILEHAQLRGRVTLEREVRVFGCHAGAVVAHRDALQARAFDRDFDAPRARVERVLHELLHDRRRPLDDPRPRRSDRPARAAKWRCATSSKTYYETRRFCRRTGVTALYGRVTMPYPPLSEVR